MAEEHGSVTSSSIEPTIRTDEKEVNEEDAFVPGDTSGCSRLY